MIAWALVGTVAIATGVAYSSGVARTSSTASDTSHGESSPLFGQPPASEFPLYRDAVTTTDLTIAFDDLWGQLPHDTNVFTIAIPANDPRTGNPYPAGTTFAVNIYATNQPDIVNGAGGHTPWTNLNLQWTIAPCPGGAFFNETTANPTFAVPTVQAVMRVTSGTIHVALGSLAPGTTYCGGIKQAFPDASDSNATYILRPYATDAEANAANPAWTSAVPVAPLFTALIQRTS